MMAAMEMIVQPRMHQQRLLREWLWIVSVLAYQTAPKKMERNRMMVMRIYKRVGGRAMRLPIPAIRFACSSNLASCRVRRLSAAWVRLSSISEKCSTKTL